MGGMMIAKTWSLAFLLRKSVLVGSFVGLVACGGTSTDTNEDNNLDDIIDGGPGSGSGGGSDDGSGGGSDNGSGGGSDGGSGSSNLAPIANTQNTTNISGLVPLTVNFDGSASSDSDGSIVSYQWRFSDSAATTSSNVSDSFTYTEPGLYSAILNVVDDGGLVGRDVVLITALSPGAPNNTPPTPLIEVSAISGTSPLTVNFDASGSSDSDGLIQSFAWDFGDNTSAVGETSTHQFTNIGTYVVRLTVTDDSDVSSFTTVEINVVEEAAANTAPQANIEIKSSNGLIFSLSAEGSVDAEGDTLSYLWSMGDGKQYFNRDISHMYGAVNEYEVSLVVTDENGASNTTTLTLRAEEPSADPQFSNFSSDASNGEFLYNSNNCSGCHGQTGILSTNGGDAINALDVNKYTPQTLFLKIHQEMPVISGSPSDCEDQCAADITAFLEAWRSTVEVSCDTSSPLTYSPRRLALLTTEEYQNTLEDVLGITDDFTDKIISDATKGNFPNNATTNVDENRMNKYWSAGESIAALAVANDLPFACGLEDNCSEEFINTILIRMFRRPLTTDEQATFQSIFDQASNGKEGMELAILAAVNSPQFLYRSEVGELVSTVLSTDPEPYLRPIPSTVQSFFMRGNEGFTQVPYYIDDNFGSYTFGSNDIVSISFKGTQDGQGNFPSVNLTINNVSIPPFDITSTSAKTFRFTVNDKAGETPFIQINSNDKLFIGKITFGQSELFTPARGDEEKMKLADSDAYMLDPFEYATLLAYTLTGTAPDEELMDAALNDGLHFEDQVRAQVERLIDSPRGQERMGVFAGYWFNTDRVVTSDANRDSATFPNYTDDVRESMAEEVRALFREIFYTDRPFESFYNGDFTVVNSTLAEYYNIPSGSTGPNDWAVSDGLDERGGILTTGAFMTVNAHPDKSAPIVRAVRTREQALCQHIAPPPLLVADRDALLQLAEDEYRQGISTTRRYYEVITDSPACAGCHEKQINPMFGTEDFDQVGQFRTTQKGTTGLTLDIDRSGILYGPNDPTDTSSSIPFVGAKGLSKVIADLPGVEACLLEKSFRFVAGLPLTASAVDSTFEAPLSEAQANDFACAADKAKSVYVSSGHSPRAVITELVMQDLLRYRKAK